MLTNELVVNGKGFSRRRSLLWWQDSIAQLPDLILDEPPRGACQLIHAPDAGEIFAVDAFCIVTGAVLAHEHGRNTQTLMPQGAYLGGGIVHTVGAAVITTQRLFRAGRYAAAVVGGSIRQMSRCRGAGPGSKLTRSPAARRARPSRFQPDAKYWSIPCRLLSAKPLSTRRTV